ncbi:hypothetical protein Cgig2_010573 [Carnegiea gigantea]|uniref:Uncharacterized protein n=1 Tax=Carnegiea gigantea TaxID=171969 RepID=A0A9Q1KTR7_9CARY|nr:hypothetical protein Cgig2_010573 [Carnegiea gigantea]
MGRLGSLRVWPHEGVRGTGLGRKRLLGLDSKRRLGQGEVKFTGLSNRSLLGLDCRLRLDPRIVSRDLGSNSLTLTFGPQLLQEKSSSPLDFTRMFREGLDEMRITIETLRLVAEIVEKRIDEGSFMRIPYTLRMGGEEYNSRFVSIGPFHYPDDDRACRGSVSSFVAMEANKQLYMLKLLQKTPSCEVTLERCWNFIRENKKRIKDCYSEETIKSSISLSSVMLVDGKHRGGVARDRHAPPTKVVFTIFFLPKPLFTVDLRSHRKKTGKRTIFGSACIHAPPPQWRVRRNGGGGCRARGVKEGAWCSISMATALGEPEKQRWAEGSKRVEREFRQRDTEREKDSGIYLRSATKLKAIGMIFECDTKSKLLDITLSGKVLRIPTLIINYYTEALLKNLVTYEHVSPKSKGYFTSYLCFMSHLIKNLNDVKTLESAGIIENQLGNKKDASRLFSVMDEKLWLKDFYYRNLCDDIEAYARSRWQKHNHVLKKRYFSSPRTILLVFTTTTILLLAFLQTIYTIMSYYQSRTLRS